MHNRFSQNELATLNEMAYSGKKVKISGINSIGQPFEVVGRIYTSGDRITGVYGDKLLLEFGNDKDREINDDPKWYASYLLNLEVSKFPSGLVILSIKNEQEEEIYKAKNVSQIKNIARVNNDTVMEEYEKYPIKSMDPVTAELKNLIGKPVFLTSFGLNNGVLERIGRVDKKGRPMAYILCGQSISGYTQINDKTVLYTVNENDEAEKLADNRINPTLCHNCFDENVPDFENDKEEENSL